MDSTEIDGNPMEPQFLEGFLEIDGELHDVLLGVIYPRMSLDFRRIV